MKVEPPQITISATLYQRIQTGRIPTVPIGPYFINNDLADRFHVIFPEAPENKYVTRSITVRGPAEVVAQLVHDASESKSAIRGFIMISREDVKNGGERGPTPKEVHVINLPKGVEVAEEPEKVDIHLVPRP